MNSAKKKVVVYKREALELKSDLKNQDQVKTKMAATVRKPVRKKSSKQPKLKVTKSRSNKDFTNDYDMRRGNDDLILNEKLSIEYNFTARDLAVLETVKDSVAQKHQEEFEKQEASKEPFRPHRNLEDIFELRIYKNAHKELRKRLGKEKYESYMKLLDEFNEEMEQKSKNGDSYTYFRLI